MLFQKEYENGHIISSEMQSLGSRFYSETYNCSLCLKLDWKMYKVTYS